MLAVGACGDVGADGSATWRTARQPQCGLPDCSPPAPPPDRILAPDFDDPKHRNLALPIEAVGSPSPRGTVPQVGQLRFERIDGGDLARHATPVRRDDVLGYGWGAALLDHDGDRDLDIFLGGRPLSSVPPCIYRNDSTPGHVHFTRLDATCVHAFGDIFAGGAVDLDDDGVDELIAGGRNEVFWIRFGDTIDVVDLLELDGPTNRRLCSLTAALPFDVDQDGRLDIILGCQPRSHEGITRAEADIAIRNLPDGRLEYFPDDVTEGWLRAANTLAFGVLDIDLDGLLDLLYVVDTFSNASNRNVLLDPGGPQLRCSPLAECVFEDERFLPDSSAWGSFMGVGNVAIEPGFDAVYITDWGPNRLIEWAGGDSADRAAMQGAGLADRGRHDLFSWGVVVDDFDLDGTDDLYVSQGGIDVFGDEVTARHRDMFLLQGSDGRFFEVGEVAGIPPNDDVVDGLRPYFQSRAALKADFDADGRLEILVLAYAGVHRLLTEIRPEPGRCTLIPRSHTVPAVGYGFGVRNDGEPRFARRDVQGQLQSSASPHIVASAARGVLRFPSGAEIDFDCGDGHGPVEVEEPEWIRLSPTGAEVAVEVSAPWWPSPLVLEAAVRHDDGSVVRVRPRWEEDVDRYVFPIGPDAVDVMLRIETRWVGRWLPIR